MRHVERWFERWWRKRTVALRVLQRSQTVQTAQLGACTYIMTDQKAQFAARLARVASRTISAQTLVALSTLTESPWPRPEPPRLVREHLYQSVGLFDSHRRPPSLLEPHTPVLDPLKAGLEKRAEKSALTHIQECQAHCPSSQRGTMPTSISSESYTI